MFIIFIWIGFRINFVLEFLFLEGMFVFLIGWFLSGEFFDFNLYVGDVGYGLVFGFIGGGKLVLLGLFVV